jgi:hypothetical protein
LITDCTSTTFSGDEGWQSNEALMEIAKISVRLLTTTFQILLPYANDYYYSLAKKAGLLRQNGDLECNTLRTEINDMYGRQYLDEMGLNIERRRYAWPTRMLHRPTSFHPLMHILLSAYLKNRLERFASASPRPHIDRTIGCPNPFAAHGSGHAVEQVKVKQDTSGGNVYIANCSCGIRFTFMHCTGSGMPLNPVIVHFGKDWRASAMSLRIEGFSYLDIARKMNVSRTNVVNMLSAERGPRANASKAQVMDWRSQWIAVLDSIAPAGYVVAQKKASRLYKLLRKFDREWFAKQGRLRHLSSRGVPREDWAKYDRRWCAELQEAAARIKKKGPPLVRASRAAIAGDAGLGRILRKATILQLPACKAGLEQLEESVELFRIRRLEAVARELTLRGAETYSAATLLRHAHLNTLGDKIPPIVVAAALRLQKLEPSRQKRRNTLAS